MIHFITAEVPPATTTINAAAAPPPTAVARRLPLPAAAGNAEPTRPVQDPGAGAEGVPLLRNPGPAATTSIQAASYVQVS